MSSRRTGLIVIALCLLPIVPSCRQGEGPVRTARESLPGKRRPNIIWLTADTLRADHLKLHGYPRDTMPAIEAFAKTAVVFDNAVVPRGSTRPSYASMLTGLYPFHHGVRSNETELHPDLVTLQDHLKSAGYHTAAFVSNFTLVSEISGFQQGFDVYDDRMNDRGGYERTAEKTLSAILKWLDSDPPRPFFLFTNFIDPHGPYNPPERFRQQYHSSQTLMLDPKRIPDYIRVEGQLNFYDYVDRYDAEIRYLDETLGKLIAELKQRGLWDDSVIVFTADHGESLGEHRLYFEHHYHVWEETVRVPLIVRLPQSEAGGPDPFRSKRIDSLVSPMDLTPTILSYLNLPSDIRFDGRSLLPLMKGLGDDNRHLLIEFPDVATWQVSLPDVYALRTTHHKLIRVLDQNTGQIKEEAVFDLRSDPSEQRPERFNPQQPQHLALASQIDPLLAQVRNYALPFALTVYEIPFDAQLDMVKRKRLANRTSVKVLTEEQVARLRSLGYVQ